MKKLAIVLFVACTSCTARSNIKKINNYLDNYNPEASSVLTYYRAQDDCFNTYVTEYIDECKRLNQTAIIFSSRRLFCSKKNPTTKEGGTVVN